MVKIDGYSQEVLKQINPQNIRLYLLSRGWKQEMSTAFFNIFSSPIDSSVVTVPNNRDYSDYSRRIDEVIRTISNSEKISIQHIIAGITISTATDTIEYHYEPKNGEIGLIPIQDMLTIIKVGTDLNNYGCRDAYEYKPSYRNSNWKGKKELDAIRIGPTLPGSYVVQFIYPTLNHPQSVNTTLFNEICPDNKVLFDTCNKIESSLRSIVDAAENGKTTIDPELKISHNFVSSTLELNFENADIEIRRLRTFKKQEYVVKPIKLTRRIIKRLSIIEKNMRPEELLREQNFIGKITSIRDPRDYPEDYGKVKIKYIDDQGKAKSIFFILEDENELNEAHDAFKHHRNVSISGIVTGPNNSRHLEDLVEFKVL